MRSLELRPTINFPLTTSVFRVGKNLPKMLIANCWQIIQKKSWWFFWRFHHIASFLSAYLPHGQAQITPVCQGTTHQTIAILPKDEALMSVVASSSTPGFVTLPLLQTIFGLSSPHAQTSIWCNLVLLLTNIPLHLPLSPCILVRFFTMSFGDWGSLQLRLWDFLQVNTSSLLQWQVRQEDSALWWSLGGALGICNRESRSHKKGRWML